MLKTDVSNFIRAGIVPLHKSGRWMIILLLYVLLLIPQKIHAKEKLTISLKDTTVSAVIDQIRAQTDIDFIFNHEALEKCPNVTIEVKNASVEEVLNQCFINSVLTFNKIKNTIVIIPVEESKSALKNYKAEGKLRGKVFDGDSKITLPAATVLIESTNVSRGVSTDENGEFRIDKLPVGRHKIRVSYIGYEEKVLPEILVGSSKEVMVEVALFEKIDSLSELAVGIGKGRPLNQMSLVSTRSFSVEETKRYAASVSDPARMAQVFAGVSGYDDSSNEIVIRGNSPNWMQWRLEGVEIPSPNHFSEEGFTSGAVSILSSDMLATSDFYMGAFPAEFGNTLSGVFDLRLRNGNNEHHEFSAQAGILGFDFSAEGPLKKGYKGSFLANARYSSLALLDKVNIHISENTVPSYEDLSFKLNLPTNNFGTFSLWAIGGKSKTVEEYIPEDNSEFSLLGYSDFNRSRMYAAGLTHTIFPNQNSYVRTVISNTYKYSGQVYEILYQDHQRQLNMQDELQSQGLRINTLYNRKISSALTIRTGVTLNNTGYGYQSSITGDDGNMITFLNGEGSTYLLQSYVQGKYRITDRLTSTLGMHYAYFALSHDHSLEPRLAFRLQLDNQQTLTFGFGRHSKNEDLPVYFVDAENQNGNHSNPNIGLKMTKANHYVMGYEKHFGNDVQIKTEVYFQKIMKLPVPVNSDNYYLMPFFGSLSADSLANLGEARNMGVELTVQKYFTNNYYLLFTTSLFDSKFKPSNGKWYNSKYNSNYVSNFVGGKEFDWGDDKMFEVNAKVIWYGGKRLLPLDLEASKEKGEAVYDVSRIFEVKGPDYFRIDLGFDLHFYKKKSEHIISLDIQNATNQTNILTEEYNPITKNIDYYYLAGFFPILHYRIEF